MENAAVNVWRKCSSCKKPIAFGAKYYVCSVSTCNGQRTGYVFCSVPCFEMHLPAARHKDAAAIEQVAPRSGAGPSSSSGSAGTREPQRTIVKAVAGGTPTPSSNSPLKIPRETLIIASRLKEYIQARAEMNSSAGILDILSDQVRVLSDRAVENARADGRKTVLERDFDFLKKSLR